MLAQGLKEHFELQNRIAGYETVEGYFVDIGIYSSSHSTGRHHHGTTYYLIYEYQVDGLVTFAFGGGFWYLIAESFSPLALFSAAGPLALIPLMLTAVGILLIGRGFLGKHNP